MKQLSKGIYVILGCISLVLGIVGIVLPILPTTPFFLITSFCFMKGSDKFNTWFKKTKIYRRYLESYITNRAMTLRQKLKILIVADIMIAIPLVIVESIHVKIFLMLVILTKLYYFVFKIKTIKTTAITQAKECSKEVHYK